MTETVTTCPICNVEHNKTRDFVRMTDTTAMYKQCLNCQAVYLGERMDDAELANWYKSGEYRKHTEEKDPGNAEALRQTQEKAQFLAEFLRGPFKAHLDIGCWRGDLLREMRRKYPDILSMGVDLYNEQDEFAAFANIKDVPGQFDLVTCIQTLEHINHPREMISAIYDHLEEGGMFVCEVPNRRSTLAAFSAPQHVVAYDEMVLRRLCCGFSDIQVIAHGIPHNSPLDLYLLLFGTK